MPTGDRRRTGWGSGAVGGGPLIDSPAMVGEWDPAAGGWSARDWVPGPAGTVGLTLPGDVELEVDVASPGVFVGLWVAAGPGGRVADRARETLVALLGRPRTDDLLGPIDPGARQLVGTEWERSRTRLRGTDPTGLSVAPALTTHALALDQAAQPGATVLVRALAAVDAAAAASELPELDLEVADLAAGAAGLLLDVRDEIGGARGSALSGRLRTLTPLLDDRGTRRALDRLVRQLEEGSGGRVASSRSEAAPPVAAPAAMPTAAAPARTRAMSVAPLLPVDVSTVAESYGIVAAAARATTDAEIEVRLPGRADLAERLWARAHDPDGVPLAASRVVEHGGDAVARLLVPPRFLRSTRVDLTDRPADPQVPPRLRAIGDAIDHGRAASRADRLHDVKESYSRWRRSEEAWRRAGDDDRAATAQRFSDAETFRRDVGPELLADGAIESGRI